MSYTILSARYANNDHTAAIVSTAEFGDVCISEQDRPELWQKMILLDGVAPYESPNEEPQQ